MLACWNGWLPGWMVGWVDGQLGLMVGWLEWFACWPVEGGWGGELVECMVA